VIGCGAMGTLVGGLLASAGREVWMISRDRRRAAAFERQGIRITGSSRRQARVRATADSRRAPRVALALILVKAYDTPYAADVAASLLAADGVAVTLQNGLGNVETLARVLGRRRVVGGVTAHGATLLGVGRVRHAGRGETVIAAPRRSAADAAGVAQWLSESGIPTEVGDDLSALLWSKLVLNAGINPVAAITRLRNGDLMEAPEAAALVGEATAEAARVAAARGLAMDAEAAVERVGEVCRATAKNVNSMLHDVLRHRRTEVEAINGAIVAEARRTGVAAPVNTFLLRAVRAIEDSYSLQVGRIQR
jgi:2-dehydropantoate 2-reductase